MTDRRLAPTVAAAAPIATGVAIVGIAVGGAPARLLAAAAAVPALVFVLGRPRLALLLLVATGPIESSLQISPNPQLTLVKLAGLVTFASFAFDAVWRRRRLRFDVTSGVLFLLLAVALISTLGARSTGDAVATVLRYASFVGLYLVATQWRRDEGLVVSMAWVLTTSSSIASFLALQAYLSGATPLVTPRYGDVNDLAFTLVTTLPLAVWLLRFGGWRRAATLGMISVIGLGIVLSLSRGALLALGAAVMWHALTERRHIPILITAGFATVVVSLLVVNGDAASRVDDTVRAKSNIAAFNVETRLDAWDAAVELTVEHPIVGVGPGNFGYYYFEKSGRPPGTFGLRVVHDAYLDVAAELGLTGLVLFLLYLGSVFHRSSVARRLHQGPSGLASAVRTGLVAACVASLTLSEQYFPPFWVLGAMATILWGGAAGVDSEGRGEGAPIPLRAPA